MFEHTEIGTSRERVEEQVRNWCERARVDGRWPMLSDASSVAIAAGRLDAPTREVLAARRRAGKSVPSIGGFATARTLAEERSRWLAKDTKNKPGSALVYRVRATELTKRLDHLRTIVVMSTDCYAHGVRAVRRERRDGIHLDLDQRDALFDGLLHTPVPRQHIGGLAARTGLSVLDVAADRVAEVSKNTRFETVGDRASAMMAQVADQKDDVFADRYETLLFIAGTSYDRVNSSRAWKSEQFLIQRTQLDLAEELTQVAVDTNSLQEISTELDDIARVMLDDATRVQVATRRAALESVWSQLIDRVAALVRVADLVTRAAGDHSAMDVVQKARSLDNRIDALVSRAGNRELSADNTHFVGDQIT
ncbi:hypothetical protein E5720_17225 [Rhodococcus sp. PAMC28707]|uniref:hypothetical protein n=1 Tax=unclassified Rhodococcus (in: high G+C Gram-positive bacteria) TaxID=192944 RepID=UPI00109DCFF9|nr:MULTISPECIES: hypothetical protein [unclassified Rhodococcus (in: high G+C Gram-positive bacteria)]QCB51856.1 hypothetical protein E5769_18295 [Rhodococcus sp. PAMC28705]QCB59975.1 hypothetical protein E5720_17225 [Rhodococcus sp. PAMC28707]